MENLFTLSYDPGGYEAVEEWLSGDPQQLFAIARKWFDCFRECGDDVNEQLHDGCPTACIQEAAVGYVNVYKTHVNVGFFNGAFLKDPAQLLEGQGKRMRHVKIHPDEDLDSNALAELIRAAYQDIKQRV